MSSKLGKMSDRARMYRITSDHGLEIDCRRDLDDAAGNIETLVRYARLLELKLLENEMSFDERESRATLLERMASDVSAGREFEDFVIQSLSPNVTDLEAVTCYLTFKAQSEREPRRRRGQKPTAPRNNPELEEPTWPADPVWGTDERGRFYYRDYDGESLVAWKTGDEDGSIWLDKSGQGPVFVKAEHVSVITDNLGALR